MKKYLISAFSLVAISSGLLFTSNSTIESKNLNNDVKDSVITIDDLANDLSTYDWAANDYTYVLQSDVDFSDFSNSPTSYNYTVNPTNTLTFLGNGHKFFNKEIYKGSLDNDHDVYDFSNTYLTQNYLFTSISNVNISNLMFDNFAFFAKDATNVNFEDIVFQNVDISHLSFPLEELHIGLFIQSLTDGNFKNLVVNNVSSNSHYIESSNSNSNNVNLAFISQIKGDFSLDSFYIDNVSYDYWKVSDNNNDVKRGINIATFSNDLTGIDNLVINDGYLNNLYFLNNTPFASFDLKQYSIFANEMISWNDNFKVGNIMIGNQIEVDKKTTDNALDLNFFSSDFGVIDSTIINPNGDENPNIILEMLPTNTINLFPNQSELIKSVEATTFLNSDFQKDILTSNMFYLQNQKLPIVPIGAPIASVNTTQINKSFLKTRNDIMVNFKGILFPHEDVLLTIKANNKVAMKKTFAYPEVTDTIQVLDLSLWKHKNYSVEITIGDLTLPTQKISDSDLAPLIILIALIILLIILILIFFLLLSIRRKIIERKNTQTEIAVLEDIINEHGIVLHKNETNAYESGENYQSVSDNDPYNQQYENEYDEFDQQYSNEYDYDQEYDDDYYV